MTKLLNLELANVLKSYHSPLITEREIAQILLSLGGPHSKEPAYYLSRLAKEGLIAPQPDFRSAVWTITGSPISLSPAQICCTVDPSCYVSHLSAMADHKLTLASPDKLYISRPNNKSWSTVRKQALINGQTHLYRVSLPRRILNHQIKIFETISPGETELHSDNQLRISTVAQVFYESVDQPHLCGGIKNVLKIWEEYSGRYLDQITSTIDKFGSRIQKIRAGYILEERLQLVHERVLSWLLLAQRGGSSKLDPTRPYSNHYSEKWMLSINVP